MKRFFRWAVGLIVIVIVGYNVIGPDFTWSQTLVLEIETPSSLKTGTSTVSMAVGRHSGIPGFGSRGYKSLRGEATVVEVAPGRYLFALLSGQKELAQKVFADDIIPRSKGYGQSLKLLVGLRKTRAIPLDQYPLLVTFDDINDPISVKRIDPNDFAASFGEGYGIKSITLEISRSNMLWIFGGYAPTGQVKKVLGWLGPHPEPKLGPATGGTTNIPFYRDVAHGDFIRN